ncbi:unnamed protein product [Prunus brigantina]
MTQQEAQATPDVITGMIPIFGYFARVLIDPGATHSFIAHSFLPYASVRPTPIAGNFSISLPTGDALLANMVFRDCYVQVGDAMLEADLIPLELVDLDIILGMDWLEKHRASVDCFRKEVVFRSPGQPEVVFHGERRVLPSCLISAIRAKRLLKKGCVGYLLMLAAQISRPEFTINMVLVGGLDDDVAEEQLGQRPKTKEELLAMAFNEVIPRDDPNKYRYLKPLNLNLATPKDEYPMPMSDLLVDGAAKHELLSFMDGHAGYNQIFIAEEDIHKTAFRCPGAIGTYEWVVMPFGLKNAGATYQRAMNLIFHDLIGRTIEIRPLTPLLRLKEAEQFIWETEHQVAFDDIKKYLSQPPVLMPPKRGKPLRLYISASESSIGCLLAQNNESEREQAVHYLSRTLNMAELNYSPVEKLCLALYFAATKLRHYMLPSLTGDYQCTSENLALYYVTALNTADQFSRISFVHIPRAENHEANEMAQVASGVSIPADDLDRVIRIEKRTLPALAERGMTAQLASAEVSDEVETADTDWRYPIHEAFWELSGFGVIGTPKLSELGLEQSQDG